jgi:hypothetical protein
MWMEDRQQNEADDEYYGRNTEGMKMRHAERETQGADWGTLLEAQVQVTDYMTKGNEFNEFQNCRAI